MLDDASALEKTGQSACRGFRILANFFSMKYRRRLGATATFSVSVDGETKKALKARADRLHGGNMSALITELGREAARADAVERLIARAGGSRLTPARRNEIDVDLEEGWRYARDHAKTTKRTKKNRAA